MNYDLIKFEKVNHGFKKATLYDLHICDLQVSKMSCKLIYPNFSMYIPLSSRNVVKQLIFEIYEKNKKQVELAEYCYDNDFISINKMKTILNA